MCLDRWPARHQAVNRHPLDNLQRRDKPSVKAVSPRPQVASLHRVVSPQSVDKPSMPVKPRQAADPSKAVAVMRRAGPPKQAGWPRVEDLLWPVVKRMWLAVNRS